MTITWHDLAAAGAPPVTMVRTPTPFSRRPAPTTTRVLTPTAAAIHVVEDVEPSASPPPRFMFPGSVDILNEAPPSHLTDDANKENEYKPVEEDDEEVDEELLEALATKSDCDAVRRKIQRFLARKTMTQSAFLRAINVNPNSFRNFMTQKGKMTGVNNGTYDGALVFFHKLEKKEGAAITSKGAAKPRGAANAKGPRKEQNAQIRAFFDKINAVILEEPVFVFDDCDDIRRNINELIESKTVTQAALLRELDVNSNSLRRFMTMKGKRQGCSNGVYVKAYCFFEKLRIAENKPKSSKRLKNESELPEGYSLEREPSGIWCCQGVPVASMRERVTEVLQNSTRAVVLDRLRFGTLDSVVDQIMNGTMDADFLFS